MGSFARVKGWKLTRLLPARFKGEYHLPYKTALLIWGVTILAASITGCISYQSVRHINSGCAGMISVDTAVPFPYRD